MKFPKFLLPVVAVLLAFSAVQCSSSSPEQAETAANDLTLVGGNPIATAVVTAASEESETAEATEPTPEVNEPEAGAPESAREEAATTTVVEAPPTQPAATETPSAPSAQEQAVPTNEPKTAPVTEPAASPRPDHTGWDAMLKANVSASGKVDYDGLKLRRAQLDQYLNTLRQNPPQSDWTRNEKLAYWINVYNAFTVDLILRNYPVKSIMDINGGKAWNLPVADIGGKKYTLDQVENQVIRPTFKEPRIHFAVNCAAASCPKLLNAAYTADKLEEQLEAQTRYFVNSASNNVLSANAVQISKIFEWYAVDFESFGSITTFLNQYAETKVNPSAKVSYLEYDWKLNN